MSIDESSTPTLQELIDERIELRLRSVTGPEIGQIVSFDEDAQTATVQPLVMNVRLNEDGTRIASRRPEINDVPVCFFGGSAQGRITSPVKAGHEVLLIFCRVHIDRWHLNGGIVDPGFVDPEQNTGRLSDVIAITGLSSIPNIPTEAPTDALVLHGDDIRAGGVGADDPVARKSDVDSVVAKLNHFIGIHNVHIHTVQVTIPSGSGFTTGIVPTPVGIETPMVTPDYSPVLKST